MRLYVCMVRICVVYAHMCVQVCMPRLPVGPERDASYPAFMGPLTALGPSLSLRLDLASSQQAQQLS